MTNTTTPSTRRVKMISDTNGAPDPGTHTYLYEAGKVYDVTERLAEVFIEWGYAEPADDEADVAAAPDGDEIPETEDERRAREAGEQPTQVEDLSIVDPEHHPAQAAEIQQAKDDAASGAQDAPAAVAGLDDPKITRKQLDDAAKAIGLATSNLPNKDAVRQAIADAQGGE